MIVFSPKEFKNYEDILTLRLNLDHLKKIKLKAFCLDSRIEIENDGKLFFAPNYIGMASKSKFWIKNKGVLPIDLEI